MAAMDESQPDSDEEDNDEDKKITASYVHIRKPISKLFNFQLPFWTALDQKSAVGTLKDKLEFYDLLTKDLEAGEDIDPDLNDTVVSIFEM